MHMMMAGVLTLLLGVAAGAASSSDLKMQASGESVVTMRVDGELTFGSEGQVLDYSLRSKLSPEIKALLGKTIQQWTMVPVLQGGRPVVAETPMRITLTAKTVATGYEVRLDNVIFAPLNKEDYKAQQASAAAALARGESITQAGAAPKQTVLISYATTGMRPPVYPVGLMRAGVSGIVLLNLRLNPDGTVAEAVASQSSLLDIRGRPEILDKARALLEQESIKAAKRWRYTVQAAYPEQLDATALTVRVPVEFSMGNEGSQSGRWRHEFRGPNLPVPWLMSKPDEQVVGVSDLSSGEQLFGTSPFRLRDRSVLGRAL